MPKFIRTRAGFQAKQAAAFALNDAESPVGGVIEAVGCLKKRAGLAAMAASRAFRR